MNRFKLFAGAAVFCAISTGSNVLAADQFAGEASPSSPGAEGRSADLKDIIVTARRKAESDMAVPVMVTSLGGDSLANQGAVDIYKISQLVPQLEISQGPSVTGGVLALRGISSGITNSSDQAVAINIDGVQVSNAIALRIGQFDLARVEVLKGPQALFFGKNSPAGVISFISENPTSELSGYVRTFYEFTADEIRTEAAVGGPITDSLGIRLAGYYDHMEGYFRNPLPSDYAPGIVFGPPSRRAPNREEWGGRATISFKTNDTFSAVLKMAIANVSGTSSFNEFQRISCPTGGMAGPEFLPGQNLFDCTLNRTTNPLGSVSPAVAALDPVFEGEDYDKTRQYLGSLNMEYRLSDEITLSSISGYYKSSYQGLNLNSGPVPNVVLHLPIDRRDLSQELRLASSLDGPLNFTIGAYFQDSDLDYRPSAYRGPGAPGAAIGRFDNNWYSLRGTTKSGFFQMGYEITNNLELSGGVRYTNERKRIRVVSKFTGADRALPSDVPSEIESNDWSPEISLNYRPTSDITLFTSYRQGFKSGGIATPTVGLNTSSITAFRPESTEGGEIGMKMRLLDRSLRINIAAYTYNVNDLQVSSVNPTTGTLATQNAAAAKVRGIEADFTFNPRNIDGLTITGAIGYNQARYKTYVATCYGGQTIAQGCDQVPIAGRFTSQNLAGRPLSFAPDWSGNLNVNYVFPVTSRLKAGLGGGMRFNSSYYSAGDLSPESVSKSVQFFDLQARVMDADDKWEIALIGRNITDKLRPMLAFDTFATGTLSGQATGTRADLGAFANRPREMILQATYRF